MSFHRGRGRGRGRGIYKTFSGFGVDRPAGSSASISQAQLTKTSSTNVPSSGHRYTNTINVNLNVESEDFLVKLKNLWELCEYRRLQVFMYRFVMVLDRKSPNVTAMLRQRFNSSANPFEEAIRLIYNCLDFKNAKPKSLSFLIMEELKSWKVECSADVSHFLSKEVKLSAFNIVRKQSLFALMKLVADVYEMGTDCDIFLDVIKHMVEEHQYKEVRCIGFVCNGL